MLSPNKSETFYNYGEFVKTGTSLMVAIMLIDDFYEEGMDELPPHLPGFDSMKIRPCWRTAR